MKRFLSLMLAIVLMISCAGACAESFSLHNGTRFGMTKEEVTKIEEENGVILEKAEKSLIWPNVDALESEGWISIAGQPGSELYYVFDDDKLTTCLYFYYDAPAFLTGNYSIGEETVLNALVKKYGNPTTTIDNYVNVGAAFDAISQYMHMYNGDYFDGSRVSENLYQWIVPSDEGYVDIMFLTVYSEYEYRFISYSLRTFEEMEGVLQTEADKQNQLDTDL